MLVPIPVLFHKYQKVFIYSYLVKSKKSDNKYVMKFLHLGSHHLVKNRDIALQIGLGIFHTHFSHLYFVFA